MDGVAPADDEADQQVVLEELYDENYEPTEAEILEYAKWLGMDVDNERELLWIARAGLKEPVPEGWKPCQAPSKEIYYFNFITGESIWDHPCDEHFRRLYAEHKAQLQEQRRLAGTQQQIEQQQPQPDGSWQDQQLSSAGEPAKAVRAPTLTLPSDSAVQHTDVEPLQLPLTSPSGTLSTIASATTASVVQSPVNGLAQGNGTIGSEAQQQRDAAVEEPSSTPTAPEAAAAASQQLVQDAAARRSTTGSAGGSAGDLMGPSMAVDWRAEAAAADQEERLRFRQHLEEDRRVWEQHMQAERQALHDQHQQRLWAMSQELQEQEQLAAAQLKAEQDARLTSLRLELQNTLKGLEQELQDARTQHAAHMQQLDSQHEELEAQAKHMLQQAQQRLSQSALTNTELSVARDKAAAAAEMEAVAEATGQRPELLAAAKQKVEQELSAEVAAYRANRRAETLRQLAGQLSDDTAAAAQQLEQHTAELRRLEDAVADRAAVLQKLNEELASKQHKQLQSSLGDLCGDNQLAASCREQLATVQQQLAQSERQLAATDTALVDKRAAVAEAEEQLAAVRREVSVCEPRLSSLRQQLQELEANIRTRDTEHKQRQADVTLATRRLQELREEVSRRQGQLDSLEALYNERQESLRQTANELAWRRGELATLESSLSESLRRKADAEFQALEEQLRRTRKAAADAAADLSARQLTLAEVNGQLAAKQAQLEGLEGSLAAKNRELQDVLAQLQAAAAQEFQDAKKLLLQEEAHLLESERRSMQRRVSDQVEAERRAALAAGRRRIERELSAQLAEEASHSREQQQKHWLGLAATGGQSLQGSRRGVSSSSKAPGVQDTAGTGQQPSTPSAAMLSSGAAWRQQPQPQHAELQEEDGQLQGPDMTSGSMQHAKIQDGGVNRGVKSMTHAVAAIGNGISRRRARSCSPERPSRGAGADDIGSSRSASAVAAAVGVPAFKSNGLNQSSLQREPDSPAVNAPDRQSPVAPPQQLLWGTARPSDGGDDGGLSSGLQIAAAAVVRELRALGAELSTGHGGDATNSWTADLLGLQAFPTVSQTAQHAAGSCQLEPYSSLVTAARGFIKQRRTDIQQHQEAIMAAQADWKAVLAAMEEQQRLHSTAGATPPPELTQAVQQLRQLKGVLQDQIHSLNEDTQRIKAFKARVHQLKATVELLQLHNAQQQQQQQPPGAALGTLSNLLSSLAGLQQKQQQWLEQQDEKQQHWQQQQQPPVVAPPGMLSSPWVPARRRGDSGTQWQQQQHHHHHHQPYKGVVSASPLDKVTTALQAALDVATSWGTPGPPAAGTPAQPEAAAAQPEAAAAALGTLSSRRRSLQPGPHGAAGPGSVSGAGVQGLAPEGSWGAFHKLHGEHGTAQQVMAQHSQWLQGFREQVAQVAALQPAVASSLQQRWPAAQARLNSTISTGPPLVTAAAAVRLPAAHAEAAVAGAAPQPAGEGNPDSASGLSPVASSVLLPVASSSSLTLGQPLTVDLGGDQELVISVVQKAAVS